jgi:hypothetical protein
VGEGRGDKGFRLDDECSPPEGRAIRSKTPYVDVKGVLKFLSSLYPNRAFALIRENLQNSIDAGAKNVWIGLDPTRRIATFTDDGTGISVARMNEREYFALMWSTKRGKDLIGSKGIGRLTNIAAASTVTVETHDGRRGAVFSWYSTGRFSMRRNAIRTLDHRGFSLSLQGVQPAVVADMPAKVEEVATDVFDEWLRRGVSVWFDGSQVKPKEYHGQRRTFKLKPGGELHLYWNRTGQPPRDQGVVLKCRGVRVGETTQFGIESEEWRNVAGILHLDQRSLTANRDAFEETPDFRASRDEAVRKIRAFLASYEGGRRYRMNEMAARYTRAAMEAARNLGIDLSLLGGPAGRQGEETHPASVEGDGVHAGKGEGEERERNRTRRREEGGDPGFRLIPKNFNLDDELRPFADGMSTRRGATIFVNLAHFACPKNKHARSFYIWCCGFAEIVRWGAVSPSVDLSRDRLLPSYQGWLRLWPPDLARYTSGVD